MAHAERIIKSVMLPIGSPSGPFTPPTQSAAATAAASTNPFDPPAAMAEGPHPPSGFVMGPIDAKAANTFVRSYLQLVPNSDISTLQRVVEMKVGFSALFLSTIQLKIYPSCGEQWLVFTLSTLLVRN